MARCSRDACRRWRPDAALRVLGLGLRVDGAWFCSNICVEAETERRLRDVRPRDTAAPQRPLRLGMVLLQQRGITSTQLSTALAAQNESGLKLGDQLLRLGFTTREQLLRGLATQSGVRYLSSIDTSAVRVAPGRLSADEVRALGVVPFREDEDRLLVACAAPIRHAALDALTILIGRIVEPFLVTDEDFERLQRAYIETADGAIVTTMARDITDGASRLAAVAAAAGAVSIKEAQVESLTWVRVAANGRISTLLVPPPAAGNTDTKEHAWLAATTRH